MLTYQTAFDFERDLAEYTGAPYAIVTDCCTHAIELCLRHDQVRYCVFTPYTYLSVPMTMHKLGVEYNYTEEKRQTWVGEYQFVGTRIWDSARRLERGMYRKGQMQCLSFGNTKPMSLGRVGAILLDDPAAYEHISMLRSDGRDLRIPNWANQQVIPMGYHYFPSLELCQLGQKILPSINKTPEFVAYPDCRRINIVPQTTT